MMEQTAKELFEKFLAGTCSKDELDRLMELLHENNHEAVFRQMLERVYRDVDNSLPSDTFVESDGFIGIRSEVFKKNKGGLPRFGKNRWIGIGVGIAACLAIALITGFFWQQQQKQSAKSVALTKNTQPDFFPKGNFKNQQTARAEQKYLLLPDGTQVWLNAESSLVVPDQFDSKKREVYLKGEAFFDVKHADKVPFIIHMPNNVSTTVLGTAFDIKAYDDRAFSVTVKRGKVQVHKNKKTLATLTMGQQIKMAEGPIVEPIVKVVKQENIASWTEGKLSYDALKLSEILNDLERVYNAQIELKNNKMAGEIITTTFNRSEGLKAVLKTLCLLTGTTSRKVNETYVIE